MSDFAEKRRKTEAPRGVVWSTPLLGEVRHRRWLPSEALASVIEHYWSVEWNCAAPRRVSTLPHPSVQLVFEAEGAVLSGVMTGRFHRELVGKGQVFGVKFLPASFRCFFRRSLHLLTDRRVPPEDVLGASFQACATAVLRAKSPEAKIRRVEAYFEERSERPTEVAAELNRVLRELAADTGLRRVEAVPFSRPLSPRQLQRLFKDYLGVGPKWVIARYRIHEALARCEGTESPDWAGLACDLGYADQAHFIRDFKALIGDTPGGFQRRREGRDRA